MSKKEQASENHEQGNSSLGGVSVSDLIIERRKWLLDYVWCCTELDLTDKEVDALNDRLESERGVIEWIHSR
jgi:hypothetical protein